MCKKYKIRQIWAHYDGDRFQTWPKKFKFFTTHAKPVVPKLFVLIRKGSLAIF